MTDRVKNELNVELNELKPCTDAVSREAVLNAIDKWISEYKPQHYLIQSIRELPSVTQKLGKWIDHSDEGYVECPFCEHATTCEDNIDELHYCFFCGAELSGEEQTE